MQPIFLELTFDASDCKKAGIASRDEIEDDFEAQFAATGLGTVSGGGGGFGKYNIDVDVFDEGKLEEAIASIQRLLGSLNVPQSSKIIQHEPQRREWSVYP